MPGQRMKIQQIALLLHHYINSTFKLGHQQCQTGVALTVASSSMEPCKCLQQWTTTTAIELFVLLIFFSFVNFYLWKNNKQKSGWLPIEVLYAKTQRPKRNTRNLTPERGGRCSVTRPEQHKALFDFFIWLVYLLYAVGTLPLLVSITSTLNITFKCMSQQCTAISATARTATASLNADLDQMRLVFVEWFYSNARSSEWPDSLSQQYQKRAVVRGG